MADEMTDFLSSYDQIAFLIVHQSQLQLTMTARTIGSISPTPISTPRHLRLRIQTEDISYPGQIRLKLSGKELIKLPRSLFDLLELEVLELSPERETCLFYQLHRLPSDIGSLVNLRVLILDTNVLVALPPEISLLTKLEKLTIANNHISYLPPTFSRLQSLQSFHCANNNFEVLPDVVCSIQSLMFLDFSDNQISEVPAEISNLINLETLLLCFNKITKLPDNFGDLVNLKTLWLGGNLIRTLPKSFGDLESLDWQRWRCSLCIDNNPLRQPPLEVAQMGSAEVHQYFAR